MDDLPYDDRFCWHHFAFEVDPASFAELQKVVAALVDQEDVRPLADFEWSHEDAFNRRREAVSLDVSEQEYHALFAEATQILLQCGYSVQSPEVEIACGILQI